ncbi:MAG TPA: heparin lyase I family protein [Polyangiales bacterium]|nr:heparin lyase I family protein [Polyangiales bacterium]
MFEHFAHGSASVRVVRGCSKNICWLGCVLAALSGSGCGRDLVVGKWSCERDPDASIADLAVDSPWSTGFEAEFCDYTALAGFCYNSDEASYKTVESPVHSGRYAAAFQVRADPSGYQTRCVRQGKLPTAAYYGAWYFVPETATNSDNWNLIHFQGGDPTGPQHGLWDVSLVNGADGALEAIVFDFLSGRVRRAATPTPIPIGAWFHLEFYLKRAADATGEVALYQDDQLLIRATSLVTDDSDWGQWYVGNLATRLTPSASTLYVDDVTISDTR